MSPVAKKYRECERKVGYQQYLTAMYGKYHIVNITGTYTSRLHVYRCRYCQKYHVGHYRKGR